MMLTEIAKYPMDIYICFSEFEIDSGICKHYWNIWNEIANTLIYFVLRTSTYSTYLSSKHFVFILTVYNTYDHQKLTHTGIEQRVNMVC